MPFDTYPAVDENYRFPPEIIEASAKGTPLTQNQDLNTVTTSGLHRAELGSLASSIKNRPDDFRQPFTVSVRWISQVNDILIQEAWMKVTGEYRARQMYRIKFGNTWGDWIDLDFQRPQKTLPNTLAVIGASESEGPTAWVDQLAALTSATITNFARSGDDSNAIAIRCGALPITGVVVNNLIPASGSVDLVSDQKLQLRDNRVLTTGTLSGISGTIKHNANNTFTFTRTTSGSEKVVSGTQEFVSSFSTSASTVIVIMGGNDFNQGVKASDGKTSTQVLGNYYRIVEHFEALGKTVLVCGVTTRVSTPPGSVGFDEIMEINKSLYSRYPNHYVDRQGYLSQKCIYDAGLTPTSADITAINNGDIPPQLRLADGIHETDLAQKTVAKYFMLPWLSAAGVITPISVPPSIPTLSSNFYRWGSNVDHNHDGRYYTKTETDLHRSKISYPKVYKGDLNALYENGIFRQDYSTEVTAAKNYPVSNASCVIEVYDWYVTPNNVIQKLTYENPENGVWVRNSSNGAWRPWVKAPTRNEFDTLLVPKSLSGTAANLNNVITPGFYRVNASSDASTANNFPVNLGPNPVIQIEPWGAGTNVIQTVKYPRDHGVWMRGYYGGVWQPWQNVGPANAGSRLSSLESKNFDDRYPQVKLPPILDSVPNILALPDGDYSEISNAKATVERGYPPMPLGAGWLQLRTNASGSMRWAIYRNYTSDGITWENRNYNGTWTGWSNVSASGSEDLSTTTNLNDATRLGIFYHQSANGRALPSLNYPVMEAGSLQNLPYAGGTDRVIQQYTTFQTLKTYQRSRNGGVWGAWSELGLPYDSGYRNLAPLLNPLSGTTLLRVASGMVKIDIVNATFAGSGHITLTDTGLVSVAPDGVVPQTSGVLTTVNGTGRPLEINRVGKVRILSYVSGEMLNGSLSWHMTRPTPTSAQLPGIPA